MRCACSQVSARRPEGLKLNPGSCMLPSPFFLLLSVHDVIGWVSETPGSQEFFARNFRLFVAFETHVSNSFIWPFIQQVLFTDCQLGKISECMSVFSIIES